MCKWRCIFAVICCGWLDVELVCGQGTFRNLDFEAATVPPLPAGQYGSLYCVSAASAIPYWTADLGPYLGTAPPGGITYNNFTLGSANVSLLGPNWNNSFGLPIINGNYSVILQAGDSPGPVSVSISQTGVVPASAQSIQMWIRPLESQYLLSVTLAGQSVPMQVLSQNANYEFLIGADISSFAGQTARLQISSLTDPSYHFSSFELDDIVFSNNPIPEPTPLALGLCGVLGLGWFWLRRKAPSCARP